MGEVLRHFLIVSDPAGAGLISLREFSDEAAAVVGFEAEEVARRGDDGVMVVLVSSDSIETVKRTHGNLWGSGTWGLEQMEALLDDVERRQGVPATPAR